MNSQPDLDARRLAVTPLPAWRDVGVPSARAALAAFAAATRSAGLALPGSNRPTDAEFKRLHDAYALHAGIASGDNVAQLVRPHVSHPLSALARRIVDRSIVFFEHRSTFWIPLFQFVQEDMSLRPAVSDVIAELSDVFDDLELARWFVEPNVWLGDAAPADVIGEQRARVLDAARVDRFIARG